jgi:UDP-glucose 4-epimerase
VEIYGTDYPTPDGTCIRDYIHIKDLGPGPHPWFGSRQKSGFFNLGNGDGYSVKASDRNVRKGHRQRKSRPLKSLGGAGDPPRLVAAANKAINELGWRPQYPKIEDIVKTAWAWHIKHPEGYR